MPLSLVGHTGAGLLADSSARNIKIFFFPNRLKKSNANRSLLGFPEMKLLYWIHQEQNHAWEKVPFSLVLASQELAD